MHLKVTFGQFWAILGNFENVILDKNKCKIILSKTYSRKIKEYYKFLY